MHRRLQHDAVLRRADVDAAQLILGGDLALDELADLVVGLAQILGDLADHVLVDLDDLQLGLGDLAPRLRPRGDVLRALARQPGKVALQHRQARDLDQALLVELADADQFLLDQRDFLVLGLLLRGEAGDLFVELRDALAQLRFLSGAPKHPDFEQLGFARHDVANIGIGGLIGQLWGELDLVEAALFGLQPRRARPQSVQRLDDDGEARLDHGLVETHHDIAGLDDIAVAHPDLADHAAGRVLHLLDVGIDHHRTRRDQRARNLHRRGPAAEPAGQNQHQRKPDDQMRAYRTARAFQLGGHDFFAAPASDTILIGGGDGTRCSTWPSTVSFGPNACMRPSFSTSN